MRNVIAYAKARGFLVYHTHIAKRSTEGFPDLVLVRDGRLIFAELKKEKPEKCSPSMHKKLDPTPAQTAWLEAITSVGYAGEKGIVSAYLWRPSDWPTIEDVLR